MPISMTLTRITRLGPTTTATRSSRRTMTWSLTYFLAQQHLDQLICYYQDLAGMPRDMELGEEALGQRLSRHSTWATVPTPSPAPKAKKLAKEWYEFMNSTHVEVADVARTGQKAGRCSPKETAEIAAAKSRGGNDGNRQTASSSKCKRSQGGQFPAR